MKGNIIVHESGKLIFNGKEYKCAIGKNRITENKKEGDWATPVGCFPIREIFYRSDRVEKPETSFPTKELHEDDGWCDDVSDKNYNKFVKLPYSASHEKLYRDDDIYNIIVVLGYNDDPPVSGKGSAVFMHIARQEYSPTAGCIAINMEDMLEVLANADLDTLVCIQK